ncbi:MAG: zeta toxin family protein [Burkholderiales bacterium]|nr:zeta toxin family protein [Burkholderiales bacterium]
MSQARQAASIYVLAGVNGAGKSSIAGAAFREQGADYYNPDEAARALMAANPGLTQMEANSAAWHRGRALLERAIAERLGFAFETTLGANTIPRLLAEAAEKGIEVYVWYAGLATPELHIARVRTRAARGGHDISEKDIRRRFGHSRLNLIQLLPALTALRLYDNSADADPAAGKAPAPVLVLHTERGRILNPQDLPLAPDWAKPIVAAAMKLHPG